MCAANLVVLLTHHISPTSGHLAGAIFSRICIVTQFLFNGWQSIP